MGCYTLSHSRDHAGRATHAQPSPSKTWRHLLSAGVLANITQRKRFHSASRCVIPPAAFPSRTSSPTSSSGTVYSAACHSRRLCVPQPSALMGMAIHRAQTREARGLHQSPHGQRPVAPRAARRHRDAPLHARMAGHGRALDQARAPHVGVVGTVLLRVEEQV